MMLKSVYPVFRKSLVHSRLVIHQQSLRIHQISQEAKSLPRILNDANSIDEFQYFSMKIKDLMDQEQLDYFENVIRKVENINHPVAELMRAKLHNPAFDFIMSLITKMANGGHEMTQKQQSLSNAIQLIHIGNLVHQMGIFDLSKVPNFGNSLPADHDLILGNKIALLAGDFLLANAQIKITQMRNDEVLKIISTAMCDIIDYSFIGQQDVNNNPLPFKPGQIPKATNPSFENSQQPIKLEGNSGTAVDEWMFRQILHRGFLIAKGCQASAVLAKQPMSIQKNCFELGKYFYLTWQAFVETESFEVESFHSDIKVNLLSAPVLFHLNCEPSLHKTLVDDSNALDGIDDKILFHKVSNGPGMEQARNLTAKLKRKTQNYLQHFAASDEKSKIENILSSNDFSVLKIIETINAK